MMISGNLSRPQFLDTIKSVRRLLDSIETHKLATLKDEAPATEMFEAPKQKNSLFDAGAGDPANMFKSDTPVMGGNDLDFLGGGEPV